MSGEPRRSGNMILRSPQERKEILRRVITRAETLTENVNDKTIQTLELCMEETDTINAATNINEKISNQEEVLLDSEVVNISSKVLRRCTKSLTKGMRSYNYVEFADKLVQYVRRIPDTETETPSWSLLESQLTKHFFRTPTYTPLRGLLEDQKSLITKEATKRKAVVKDAHAPVKRPENIVAVAKEEEGSEQTVLMRHFITRYWKKHRTPIDYFQLVIHPTDFGKTIENILQISFLARDGQVELTKDDAGILVVQPCSKEVTAQAQKAGKNVNVQNVIYLNIEQWKKLKTAYKLTKPMFQFNNNS